VGILVAIAPARVPDLPARIDLLQHGQQLRVPVLRIAAERLRLDVVPPHVLLALGKGPGALAGHGARLTADATVGVEDERELPLRVFLLEGIVHRASNLPVMNLRHGCPLSTPGILATRCRVESTPAPTRAAPVPRSGRPHSERLPLA